MSRYYATCHPGLEEVVANELRSPLIGAVDVAPGASGVSFAGPPRVGVLANVWLRSAVRVLREVRRGWLDPAGRGGQEVYDFVRSAAPWEELVPREDELTFSVEARVWSCTDVTSTRLAATRAKDAICDALVDANGWRPPPPSGGHAAADVPLFLSLYRDEAVLYRDMSGESLHRRGYRDAAIHRAALNEAAAAGCLSIAGWADACEAARANGNGSSSTPYRLPVLVDPMCGSGTLLIEAALMAGCVAPGLIRADAASAFHGRRTAYAFERWPDHDRATLASCLEQAEEIGIAARRAGAKPVLLGNDVHEGALSLARRAAMAAGVDNLIEFTAGDAGDFSHPALAAAREEDAATLDTLGPVTLRRGGGGILVVSNPPWGKRVGAREADGRREGFTAEGSFPNEEGDEYGDGDGDATDRYTGDAEDAWRSLGAFFRRECGGATAHLLSGDAEVTRPLRMRAARKRVLGVGGVDCRLLEYRVLPPKKEPTLEELAREEARREREE